jgi:hypothetical protein
VPEEFYDVESDPCALKNLIDDPSVKDQVNRFRNELSKRMTSSGDPLAERFKKDVLKDVPR